MIFEYERGYFGKLSKIMEKFQKICHKFAL